MRSRWVMLAVLAGAALLLAGCGGLLRNQLEDDPGAGVERSPSPNGEYLIAFEGLTIPSAARAEVESLGAVIKSEWPQIGGLLAVSSDPGFPDQAAKIRGVKAVGHNPVFALPDREDPIDGVKPPEGMEPTPLSTSTVAPTGLEDGIAQNDLYVGLQWDIMRVGGVADTWAIEQGAGVIVAVLDTGVYYPHPDIAPNYLYGKSYVPDHLDGDGNPQPAEDENDYHGHGTHVAGSIAAPITAGRIIGVAPQAGIANYKVMAGGGYGYQSWIMDGIMEAADDGVHVINMSLGGYRFMDLPTHLVSYILYARATQYAWEKGALVVSAAGNAAFDLTPGSSVYNAPGGTPASLSITSTGMEDELAFYSNYGWQNADFTGPGGGDTDVPFSYCVSAYSPLSPSMPGAMYVWMAGTSMAAPKVAGVAALIYGANPGISPTQVVRILERTAEDLGPAGYDKYFGWGLAHAYRALTR